MAKKYQFVGNSLAAEDEVTFTNDETLEKPDENKLYVNKAKKTISVYDEASNEYVPITGLTEEATEEDILALFALDNN